MGIPSLDDLRDGLGDLVAEVGELAHHPGNKIVDIVSGYDLNERSRVRDEQAAGNSERSDIYGTQSDLRGRFGGAYDPPSITAPESFDSMSHAEIKAAVDEMAVGPIRASAQGWTQIGDSLEQALTGFRHDITTLIGAGWEGLGADKANEASAKYSEASKNLAVAGKLIGTKVAEAATGIAQVKATFPPVEQGSVLGAVFNMALPQVGLIKALLHERDEAHQQAIQVMKTVYTPVMRQADTNVPVLPTPLNVVDDVDPSQVPQPGTGGGAGAAPSAGPAGPAGTSGGAWLPLENHGDHQPATTITPGAPSDTTTTGTGSNPLGDGSATIAGQPAANPNSPLAQHDPSSISTRPASTPATDGAGSGTGFTGGYGPGTGPTAGGNSGSHAGGGTGAGTGTGFGGGARSAAGLGGGGAGSGGVGGRSPGGTVGGGVAGAPASAGAGAAAGTAAAGKPGAPGAGMMPGAAARGRGDEDTEHKTPGYLVNVDNGNEIVGSLPKVAPPVLGA
ncbi:hypothetical protein [Rhodococcus sp. NPDC127528]|uniref:PPE domain-containing protein n=1 Tax=unclassified Rhodococcus (in: high G+C Gram-positive bacteria) TaxID=192944 RepID=UPI00363671D4